MGGIRENPLVCKLHYLNINHKLIIKKPIGMLAWFSVLFIKTKQMKKNLLNFKMAVIALGIFFTTAASAATFTAAVSGNWSSSATWGGTSPGGLISGDNIVIPAGMTVTMDMDVTFTGNIIFGNTFNVMGTLTNSTNNGLTITQGAMTGSGLVSVKRITFTNTGSSAFTGTLNVGSMVNSSSALGFVATANVADSLILESGILTLNAASSVILSTNSTIRVNSGSLNVSGGVFNTTNNHNVMYVGGSKTSGLELSGSSVQSVWVKMSSSTQTLTLGNDFTINGDLNFVTGKMNMSGKKLTLKGDLNMTSSNSFVSNSTSELDIEGSGNLTSGIVFDAGSSINNMTVNRSGSTVKLMSGLNVVGHLNLMSGNYSLETGSTLTMNAGSTVHLEGGALTVNSGSFVGTAAYNVEYMGASSAASGVELTGSGLNNVTVNYTSNSSKATLSNDVIIAGQLNLTSGNLDLNGKDLTLNGTMTQGTTSGFIGNNNSILNLNLSATSTNTLMFDASNRNLNKLKINLSSATSDIMLGSGLVIGNELTFTSGRLVVGTGGDLVIQSTGTITGYDETKYVVTSSNSGRLQLNINANDPSFTTFPVGTSDNYSPAYVQNSTAGSFMVRAANEFLANGTTGTDLSATTSVVKRTWHVEAATGVAVSMNLKLGWLLAAEVNGFNRNNAVLRHYTNGGWDATTAVTATAGAHGSFEVTRNGITSLSPFAVTDANTTVGIKQVAATTVNFDIYPNPAKEAIAVTAPNASTYKYELIDITGRTLVVTSNDDATTKFDVSKLEKGYYFIKMTDLQNHTTGTKRFIKD